MLHRSPRFRLSPSSPLRKGQHWLWIAALIIVFFIGYTVGASTHPTVTTPIAAPTATSKATRPVATSTPPQSIMHYKVGQTLQINGTWQVTIVAVRMSQGDQYTKPKPGNAFLLIDVTMKNISSEQLTASSLIQYKLRDENGQTYTQTLLNGTTSPDGTIQAGSPLKGTLAYEVPATLHTYVLGFIPTVGSQQVLWDIQS